MEQFKMDDGDIEQVMRVISSFGRHGEVVSLGC